MPRGKYVSHKGKHRRFNNPEEIQEQMQKMQQEQEWRKQRGDESSGDEDADKDKKDKSGSSSEESSSEDEDGKAKGVQHLIQIENPNRIQKKSKKVTEIDIEGAAAAPVLSRREREELEKVRAQANYQRLHAMGKTDEARADLARLAIIKQQREEAARRREVEKTEKEVAQQSRKEQTQKAMGRKKT